MPPLAGWSMLVLDEVDVVRHQRMKVAPREQSLTLFVLPPVKDEERFCLSEMTYSKSKEEHYP